MDQKRNERTNLGDTGAREWIDIQIAYFIVIITETEEISLLRVEIKGHN
jgi:hypothetical protein